MVRPSPRRLLVEELEAQLLQPSGGAFVVPHRDWDEVYPGVLVGGRDLGEDTATLVKLGVTHVLNAAKGNSPGQVDTSHGCFRPVGIDFLGVPANDSETFNLRPYFREAAGFIEKALYAKGKVFVHCECGISRAPTLVVAFLLLRRGLSLRQALAVVRSKRSIFPNKGFLETLIEVDFENQQKGVTRPEPPVDMALVRDYPVEYYHYPSLYPRVTTRFLSRPPFTSTYTPTFDEDFDLPLSRNELRRGIRSRSVERDLPLVRYRASSLPPRSTTPLRELTTYTSSPIHVYGSRTPALGHTYIDGRIMYRPSTVMVSQRAVRGVDFDTAPLPFSTYGYRSNYWDLPSAHYESLSTKRIRELLEPRYTSPTVSSIVPTSRYGSSTLALPFSRYRSAVVPSYIAYPKRYTSARSSFAAAEPHLHRSQHTQYRVSDGYPTRYSTYKVVYPSIFSYSSRY